MSSTPSVLTLTGSGPQPGRPNPEPDRPQREEPVPPEPTPPGPDDEGEPHHPGREPLRLR